MTTTDTLSERDRLKLRTIRESRDDSFTELDDAVLEARKKGATLREIATATGMSVSWVQQAIVRADPGNEAGVRKPKSE